jgi:hypothetical protein
MDAPDQISQVSVVRKVARRGSVRKVTQGVN